jgi:hypothetical protein
MLKNLGQATNEDQLDAVERAMAAHFGVSVEDFKKAKRRAAAGERTVDRSWTPAAKPSRSATI